MVRQRTFQLARIALMGAMLYAGQLALSALANIEIVTLLIVVFTRRFGREATAACLVYSMLTLLIGGSGIWWIAYLYIWTSFSLLVYALRRIDSWVIWAVINGAFGLCFGALCALPYVFLRSVPYAVAWWIKGIPFDITHCIGNFVIALAAGKPLDEGVKRVAKNIL